MNKSKTIFAKTFIPVLTILLIVVGFFMLFINRYVLNNLRDNVLVVYEEQMSTRKNDLENLLLGRWDTLNNGAEQITKEIEELIESKGSKLSDIKQNIGLNQDILNNITNSIIDTLSISGATEIFLILDGYGSYDNTDVRAGIYIRNSEPGTYVLNYSNLLFERGISAISKRLKLPLDSYWQSGFLLHDEETNDFFFKPLREAQAQISGNLNFRNFGYWSYRNIIDEKDLGILSYSIPLIGSDGTIFGVLGIGINENNLMKYYNYNELDRNESRAYILAKTTDGINYQPFLVKGKSYNKASILSQNIALSGQSDDEIFYVTIDAPDNAEICINLQELKLYSHNTPFENDQWALLGIQRNDELLSDYYFAKNLLNYIMLISAFICTVCVFWFSRFISVPIQQMVSSLRKSNPNTPMRLNKTYIDEIDELAESIENLSVRLSDFYSKISTIIQMSGSGISVFEYKEKENLVFCSNDFFEMMGCEDCPKTNTYVNISKYDQNIQDIFKKNPSPDDEIMEVSLPDGKKRWLRIIRKKDEESILGVVTDVTKDIIEKRRIEKERDHDALTNLLNRRSFENRLNQLINEKVDLKIGAMLVWDLDNLKFINDNFGHSTGDDYLIAFANCLIEFNSENVISARRSGDEFVTFIYGYNSIEEIEKLIGEIWKIINNTYIVLPEYSRYKISISMGKAWYPTDSVNFDTLFHYADSAMYVEKNNKKRKIRKVNLH